MERRFRVIQGGGQGRRQSIDENRHDGPITRMDLWSRVEPVSSKLFAFMVFAKLALLASLFYFVWGK